MKPFYLIGALRPYQWTKNLIIFAALVFSKHLLDLSYLLIIIQSFFIFSFLSGSVYLLNDVFDVEKDRLHPKKKHRAVASGKISIPVAIVCSFVIASLSIYCSFKLNFSFGLSALFYFVLIFL